MGAPKKPESLKIIAGTDRKDRVNIPVVEFDPITEVPAAPNWLPNAHAVNEWNRLAPILTVNKLLTDGDLGTLGQLCALHGKIVQLYAAGEAPGASMIGTLRTLQNDFGLSPVARGKVNPVGATDQKKNTFAGNGKKN
jgi:phage terminase small subunit